MEEMIRTGKCSRRPFSDWQCSITRRRDQFRYLLLTFELTQPAPQDVHRWYGARNTLQHYNEKCEPLWEAYRDDPNLANAQAYENALRDAEEFAKDYALHVKFDIKFKQRNTHVTLNLTNDEVRTINSIARNCRELCNMSSGSAERAGLRKDLDTIIDKCERALDDQVKARCVQE
jgi:predicted transport protein